MPRTSGCGQRVVEIFARGDVELGEYLSQVPFHGAGADEQLGAYLIVRVPVPGQPGDLGFLGGERDNRLYCAWAYGLSSSQKLLAGTFGECFRSVLAEHFVGGVELLAGLREPVLAA